MGEGWTKPLWPRADGTPWKVRHIDDMSVCAAVQAYQNVARSGAGYCPWPYEILSAAFGAPEKVCFRAMERADRRGLLEYGVSLRTAWLTDEGKALLRGDASATLPAEGAGDAKKEERG